MNINDEYSVEIFDISNAGEGIGRIEGVVTFVPGLVVGDRAQVRITEVKKNLARGKVLEITEPSPARTEPVCPHAERCGGCTLQSMTYEAQLALKEKQLRDKLDRIYGGPYPEPEPIVGMAEPWHFRNKTSYSIYAGKAVVQKDGSVKNTERPRVGFFDGKGRNLVETGECPISSPAAEAAARALREYIRQTGITVYDEKTKKGRLRQLVVRTGFESREVMVVLVINGKKLPKPELLAELMFDAVDSCNDAVAARLQEAAEQQGLGSIYVLDGQGQPVLDEEGIAQLDYDVIDRLDCEECWYELRSLVVNYNSNRSLAEVSTKHDVLYGAPVIRDSCGGLEFEISPFSFYQVNPLQMKKLYDTVLEFASLKGDETVFDLYCGVGTIGLYCARQAKQVWGIESVKSAVIDANRNAVINGLVNIRFLQGKAEEKIFELLDKPADASGDPQEAADRPKLSPDLVIVDPPRAGCHPELLAAIQKAAPEKIIYVSCDPGTLARDLKILTGLSEAPAGSTAGNQNAAPAGTLADLPSGSTNSPSPDRALYEIQRIREVDNFCHSVHVETCCLLRRRA
ncbi:MAG: 23S rRNA (uracil(1939)-C(5))-methyltransferase RlmD [Anaerovoracaceae bacterium]